MHEKAKTETMAPALFQQNAITVWLPKQSRKSIQIKFKFHIERSYLSEPIQRGRHNVQWIHVHWSACPISVYQGNVFDFNYYLILILHTFKNQPMKRSWILWGNYSWMSLLCLVFQQRKISRFLVSPVIEGSTAVSLFLYKLKNSVVLGSILMCLYKRGGLLPFNVDLSYAIHKSLQMRTEHLYS